MQQAKVRKVTYSTGDYKTPFRTENVADMQSDWLSSLDKAVAGGVYNAFRR